jgi:hypothetical protein
MKFGKLTVVERIESRVTPGRSIRTRWLCRCECGRSTPVYADSLASGNTQSCGRCSPKVPAENLAGREFGVWTAIEQVTNHTTLSNKRTYTKWLCRCAQCGEERIIFSSQLRRKIPYCSCQPKEKLGPHLKETPGYQAMHLRVRTARGNASGFACIDGCGRQAIEWSCKRDVPLVLDTAGRYYSLDPNAYDPRCRTCHYAYDST